MQVDNQKTEYLDLSATQKRQKAQIDVMALLDFQNKLTLLQSQINGRDYDTKKQLIADYASLQSLADSIDCEILRRTFYRLLQDNQKRAINMRQWQEKRTVGVMLHNCMAMVLKSWLIALAGFIVYSISGRD